MSHFVILSNSGEKLVEGQLWVEVTQVTMLGHMRVLPSKPQVMRPFLFGCHISFCSIFTLKEVRGHEFWTHLKMFIIIFDLLPFILINRTVNGEMRSKWH